MKSLMIYIGIALLPIILKVCNLIDGSWWLVTAGFWAPMASMMFCLAIVIVLIVIFDQRRARLRKAPSPIRALHESFFEFHEGDPDYLDRPYNIQVDERWVSDRKERLFGRSR